MTLAPYRRALALPGMRSLILISLLARMPVTATGITLTLHVVLGLDRGFGAAGLVGAAGTIGAAIGAPLMGRVTDRYGLRRMIVITTITEAAFWPTAALLPYSMLLVAALASGALTLPVFSVVRQSLAALVPEDQRRTAYSLDSMSVELSFMVGPAAGVLLATQTSTSTALLVLGCAIVAAGLAFYLLNPPVRSEDEQQDTEPVPRRSWLRPKLILVLLTTSASALVLSGTDVSIVAALRHRDEVQWAGVVICAWCMWSLLGGFVHGAVSRSLPPPMLVGVLALFTMPIGLAGSWWILALAIIPAGALCAPSLAATSEVVSKLAPAAVRGEAMGLHGSSLTVGLALGSPLAGAVVDRFGPSWGFAVAGAGGLIMLLIGLLVRSPQARAATDTPAPPADEPVPCAVPSGDPAGQRTSA